MVCQAAAASAANAAPPPPPSLVLQPLLAAQRTVASINDAETPIVAAFIEALRAQQRAAAAAQQAAAEPADTALVLQVFLAIDHTDALSDYSYAPTHREVKNLLMEMPEETPGRHAAEALIRLTNEVVKKIEGNGSESPRYFQRLVAARTAVIKVRDVLVFFRHNHGSLK